MINKTCIVGINLSKTGSSGNIMINALEYAHNNGNFDYFVITPDSDNSPYSYSYKGLNLFQKIIFYCIFKENKKCDGLYLKKYSKRIISKIKSIKKKYTSIIIHIHTVHGCSIDILTLFKFIGKNNIPCVFTLHDLWLLNGGCYFANERMYLECKKNCANDRKCLLYNNIQTDFYFLKKQALSYIKNKYIVCVSHWVMDMVELSFLCNVKKTVIYGETNIEKSQRTYPELKKQLGIKTKYLLISVSAYWNKWKGVDLIYDFAKKLPPDFSLLLIGGSFNCVGFKNLYHIEYVANNELNKYFSICDCYCSFSQSESLGLTTCEAQICGVPVVAFGHTGIKETISPLSGIVVGEDNNVDKFIESIKYVVNNKPFKQQNIIENGMRFSKYSNTKEYLKIYEQICKS